MAPGRPAVRFNSTAAPSSSPAPLHLSGSVSASTDFDHDPHSLDDDDDDDSTDIIMALDQRGHRIGCAYFTISTRTLSLLEDIDLAGKDTMLACARISLQPASDFSYEAARAKLITLRIGEPGVGPTLHVPSGQHEVDAGDRGRFMKLAAWVNTESRVSVGCVGAVLAYLMRREAIDARGGEGVGGLRVMEVEMVTLKETMMVGVEAMRALRVFEREGHPAGFGRGGTSGVDGGKEGLSLFGILNQARTPLGRTLLQTWFLRPSTSLPLITSRHSSVTLLLHPPNLPTLTPLSRALSKIGNIPSFLSALKRGKSNSEWSTLLTFILTLLHLLTLLSELLPATPPPTPSSVATEMPLFARMLETVDTLRLQEISQDIASTIDFDETSLQGRVVVKLGVDQSLDELKRAYEGMEAMLSEVAREVALTLPEEVRSQLNVLYFPQIGYLIVMPSVASDGTETLVTEGSMEEVRPAWVSEDWEFQFFTGACWYYKNPQMRELDEYFGDMYGNICDREIEIVHELQVRVLESEKLLMECAHLTAELDCLVALARAAEKYKYTRPIMTEDNVIKITKGRHPLQELCVPAYIENDTLLVGGSFSPCSLNDEPLDHIPPSTILLTGPNHSGKSVYLKQIALIVYLAHIGSFVPAESAIIGITDKILTRIQTQESVSKLQSAFLIDLQQVVDVLRQATERSLVVLDEFGKGTEESNGAGLCAAVLEELLGACEGKGGRRREEVPKVVAATHYHGIHILPYLCRSNWEMTKGKLTCRRDL
ncbi:hypothetical protein EX30DRAFT_336190 [Ascodesmis nigricans]|uniref:DNA mismatch repair proteins mutS family domain-containing protein n=1 Tax=Ascodesmis nigricans TaxID=341454 RepID=A0A4S2MQV0_9PEZI|nr:hypothetical protein EX30DRAFT_336190 [Ascodesmis nigricans]